VPLSEEELRLLEQMERALSEEDPKFASTLQGHSLRRAAHRRVILSAVAFVVGVVVLMSGVITGLWAIGIVGFLVMLGSATVGLTALRGRPLTMPIHGPHVHGHGSHGFTVIDGGRSARRSRPRSSGSFMDRVEARWRRRRDGGYGW
jgi:hypothetical protein